MHHLQETSEIRDSSEDSTKLIGEMMDCSQSSKHNDSPEINDSSHTIVNNSTYQLADNTMNDLSTNNFDQSWQQSECDMYQQQTPEIYCPMMENSYPTNNFPIETTMHNSYPLMINDTTAFNFAYNARRSQNFISPPPICETDYQVRSQEARVQSQNSMGSQKPPVYTKWTEEEDELLRAAISIYGPHKWSLIAAHVPNRTPMQCSTRWLGALNPTIHKGRWTPEEDASLRDAVSEFVDLLDSEGHPQPIPWNKIAVRIPHRTGIQCQARWSEALDPSVRKGKWSPDEDEILKGGVRRFGRCWIRIAELIDGRTQRQCRTRWVQIKNKQEKIEKGAIATTKACSSNSSSTDDDDSNDDKIFSTSTISSVSRINTIPSTLPRRQITSIITNESPILSPTDTLVTSPESCVATPECIPIFDSSNNNIVKNENLMIFNSY
ncbi:5203_t:CDS:2 [Diversispora eburnea]|uniref:5203_t:CDS:1 n=1 Tax=Diversispora eburnea TaxID=1213867 RepID=A0A9N8VSV4_9GLOM|nr:5203_t:CDS:2 [Diversispora eburnea]